MTKLFSDLPTLGLGVSLSLAAEPDPVDLAGREGGPSFVEYAGLVEVNRVNDEVQRVRDAGLPVLFHPSFINFCGSFANRPQWLARARHHIEQVQSPWFAQDLAYCFWQDGYGYSSQFGYFIPPLLNKASLDLAVERIQEVQAAVPVTVAVEPPPVTFIAGNKHVLDFFGELSERADCALLLDMGHLVSYQMAHPDEKHRLLDNIGAMNTDRVIEIHVAGGELKGDGRPIYIDAHHKGVLDETWQMLDDCLPLFSNVKALCFECEGVSEDGVLSTLGEIKNHIIERSGSEVFRQVVNDQWSGKPQA